MTTKDSDDVFVPKEDIPDFTEILEVDDDFPSTADNHVITSSLA